MLLRLPVGMTAALKLKKILENVAQIVLVGTGIKHWGETTYQGPRSKL